MVDVSKPGRISLADASLTEVGSGFYQVYFFALGCDCQLFFSAPELAFAEKFRNQAATWLTQFECRYSRFLPTSEVSRINASAGSGWVEVPAMTDVLLDLCAHSFFRTEGAFDATSLPLSKLWNWRIKRDVLPSEEEVQSALRHVGWTKVQRSPGRLRLSEGMMLDFGGVGKEFAVDTLRQMAIQSGVERILVDLGGDVAVHGDSPEGGGWYVALEDPANMGMAYAGIRVQSGEAVATSGDYRRCFEVQGRVYGHILDCRTGWPVANGTRSVSVIANRCVMAGLLSTSAMISGGAQAIEMLERSTDVAGCLWSQGRLLETRGFRRFVAAQTS